MFFALRSRGRLNSKEMGMRKRAFAWALLVLSAAPALAEEPFKYNDDQKNACLPDVRKYCKDVHPPQGADEMTTQTMFQACLNLHRDNARPDHLSQKCLDLFTQYGR
jgi:hypothetical protein